MPTIITDGAASARGFGFAGGSKKTDWSQYMIVPYSPAANSTTITQVKFYNVVTNTTDFTIDIDSPYRGSGIKIIRIGDFLFFMHQAYGIYGNLYNIKTGAIVTSGSWGSVSTEEGDVVKFGENKLGFIQKVGSSLQIVTYSFNLVTGAPTYITATGFGGAFGDSTTGYSSPQAAAACTMNADGVFDTFNNYITLNAIYSYSGGSTRTGWTSFFLNTAGNAISSLDVVTSTLNFSRPAACTGDLNRTWLAGIDTSQYIVYSNGSQAGGYLSGPGADNTNQSACGIATQAEFMYATYNPGASSATMWRMTAGTYSTSTSLPASPNSGQANAIQMFKGGMVAMVQDSSGSYGVPKFYRYDRATDSWTSGISPGGMSGGRVNPGYRVVRIYNY